MKKRWAGVNGLDGDYDDDDDTSDDDADAANGSTTSSYSTHITDAGAGIEVASTTEMGGSVASMPVTEPAETMFISRTVVLDRKGCTGSQRKFGLKLSYQSYPRDDPTARIFEVVKDGAAPHLAEEAGLDGNLDSITHINGVFIGIENFKESQNDRKMNEFVGVDKLKLTVRRVNPKYDKSCLYGGRGYVPNDALPEEFRNPEDAYSIVTTKFPSTISLFVPVAAGDGGACGRGQAWGARLKCNVAMAAEDDRLNLKPDAVQDDDNDDGDDDDAGGGGGGGGGGGSGGASSADKMKATFKPYKLMAVDHTLHKVVAGPFDGEDPMADFTTFAKEYAARMHTQAEIETSRRATITMNRIVEVGHHSAPDRATQGGGAASTSETVTRTAADGAGAGAERNSGGDVGGGDDGSKSISWNTAAKPPMSSILLQFLLGTEDEGSPLFILCGCSDVLELIWLAALELYGSELIIGDGELHGFSCAHAK